MTDGRAAGGAWHLAVDDIPERLSPGWVEASRRYGKARGGRTIRPGKLREKLHGRFAATDRWPGSRTLSVEEAA